MIAYLQALAVIVGCLVWLALLAGVMVYGLGALDARQDESIHTCRRRLFNAVACLVLLILATAGVMVASDDDRPCVTSHRVIIKGQPYTVCDQYANPDGGKPK